MMNSRDLYRDGHGFRDTWSRPTKGTEMTKPKLVAQSNMKEFDPAAELHYPIMIIKAVDPGCTIELQIENVVTGIVTRLTTTENPELDMIQFEEAIIRTFREAWKKAEENL